jgi:hypothetical protein
MKQRMLQLSDKYRSCTLIAALLLICNAAFSQSYTNTSAWGYHWNNGWFEKSIAIPSDTFAVVNQNLPHIAYKDSLLYLWSPTLHRWNTNGTIISGGSGGGGVDYTTKQNLTDTSTYDATRYWVSNLLANYTPLQRLLDSMTAARVRYLKSTDTAWLHLQVTTLQSAPGGNFIFKFPLNYNSVNHEVTINTFTPAYNANRLQGNYVEPSTPTVAGKFLGYDILNGIWRPMTPDSANLSHLTFFAGDGLEGGISGVVSIMDTVKLRTDIIPRIEALEEHEDLVGVSHEELADSTSDIRSDAWAEFYPRHSNPDSFLTRATLREADPHRITGLSIFGNIERTIYLYHADGARDSASYIDSSTGATKAYVSVTQLSDTSFQLNRDDGTHSLVTLAGSASFVTLIGNYLQKTDWSTDSTNIWNNFPNYLNLTRWLSDSTILKGLVTTNTTNIATNTTAIAGKEPTITAGTTAQYWRGDKTWQTLPTSNVATIQEVTSGTSVTINAASDLLINHSTTVSTFTATLPASPTANQVVNITAGIAVTSITISPNTSQTIVQATTPTSMSAGETIAYKFYNTKWYRQY